MSNIKSFEKFLESYKEDTFNKFKEIYPHAKYVMITGGISNIEVGVYGSYGVYR